MSVFFVSEFPFGDVTQVVGLDAGGFESWKQRKTFYQEKIHANFYCAR